MLGAIIGDIAGSRFEYDDFKSKDFQLFGDDGITPIPCEYTDDSVMTVAVADALLQAPDFADEAALEAGLVERMHYYGRRHMNSGFGNRFYQWLLEEDTRPYNSFGNGSAMRVSPAAWAADSLEEAERLARITAQVTHNHPEGIKGAQATAAAIWLAAGHTPKEAICRYVEDTYYPGLSKLSLDAIRPDYTYDVTCQGSVPPALTAFFEADGYEDALRNAISLGGDADTLACITGGVAEAFYGIPKAVARQGFGFLDEEMQKVVLAFRAAYPSCCI